MEELRDDLCVLCLIWVGCKLDCDRLLDSWRFLAIQVVDGIFRLCPLVKPDESHAPGHACVKYDAQPLIKHSASENQGCRFSVIPVTWSTSTRELMIRPNRENMSSTSFWVMDLGRPLMYKLASFIVSELGRAYETWQQGKLSCLKCAKNNNYKHVNSLSCWYAYLLLLWGQSCNFFT